MFGHHQLRYGILFERCFNRCIPLAVELQKESILLVRIFRDRFLTQVFHCPNFFLGLLLLLHLLFYAFSLLDALVNLGLSALVLLSFL